jgi:hypothetical protein
MILHRFQDAALHHSSSEGKGIMTASLKVLAALSFMLISLPAFAHGGGGGGGGGMGHGSTNRIDIDRINNNGTTNLNQSNKNTKNGNNHGNNARLIRDLQIEVKLLQLEVEALVAHGVSPNSPRITKLFERAIGIDQQLKNLGVTS